MVSRELKMVIILEEAHRIFSLKGQRSSCPGEAAASPRTRLLSQQAEVYYKQLEDSLYYPDAIELVTVGWEILTDNVRVQLKDRIPQ